MHKRYILLLVLGLMTSSLYARKATKPAALPVVREQQFTYYFYAAQQNLHQANYNQALSELLFCEALNPNDAKTQEQLGILFEALSQKDTAYAYFKRAYSLDPENCWERYFVAERMACLSRNDANGALKMQDKIDAKKGRDEYSVYLRMRLGELTGMKWKKLAPLYEEMLSYNPNNALILNNYAYGIAVNASKLKRSQYLPELKRAESMSQQALKLEPNNATYLDTYAWILHLQGQDQLALFYIQKALEYAKDEDKEVILQHYQMIKN